MSMISGFFTELVFEIMDMRMLTTPWGRLTIIGRLHIINLDEKLKSGPRP